MRAFGLVLLGLTVASSADAGVKLKAIRFPSNLGATGGTKTPPIAAPLGQSIVFEFDGKPKIGPGIADGLRITIDPLNTLGQTLGQRAFGTYEVVGNKVLFNPRIPSKPLPPGFGPQSDNATNATLPGLLPNTIYRIDVTIGGPNSVKNLTKVSGKLTLPLTFKTLPVVPGSAALMAYFINAGDDAPKLKKKKISPEPGLSSLYPNPFEDVAGFFTAVPSKNRPPFKLVFKGPLNPSLANISDNNIRLTAVADPQGVPEELPVTSDVVLTSNGLDLSTVLLYPRGILPLGHTVAIEVSDKLASLSGMVANPGPEDPMYERVAEYRVALDPTPGSPVDDRIVENFDNAQFMDSTVASEGAQLASWDSSDSNTLRASFGFGGDGALGRFMAPDESIVINLDTNFQQFPLFSGATPDVPPGTTVTGGVFAFTDFHLPPKATLRIRGTNPVVITCTGNVLIEGLIDLNGADGTKDDTFDSAITPTPGGTGGPGAGRGGDSHPLVVPSGAQSLIFIQTPQFGQSGFGPLNVAGGGGGGGQCGCSLPWLGFASSTTCANFGATGDGSRGSGGGSGSWNVYFPTAPPSTSIGGNSPTVAISGRKGGVGIGNHLPVVYDPSQPVAPEPATYMADAGNSQNALARQNPNPTFQQAYKDGLITDIWAASASPMDVDGSFWAQTHRITLGGGPGPVPFVDEDTENNFIGPGGELSTIIGGQGGGGAGSRNEGSTFKCVAPVVNIQGFPLTVLDSKGGGGGGGGGALLMQAIGTIRFQGPSARIEAKGGQGRGGEQTGGSVRGGSGAGGSGGSVILQTAADIIMNDPSLPSRVIDVSAGCGHDATNLSPSTATGVQGGDAGVVQVADGAPGGPGLVQLHTPSDSNVDKSHIRGDYFPSVFKVSCTGSSAGVTDYNPLVPTNKTPTQLTSQSVARSVWYDLGSVTADFRPPILTPAGALDGPIFGIPGQGPFFSGTDPMTGEVLTDADGDVLDPFGTDIQVDAPDLLLPDHIPNTIPYFQSVSVLFQGADEDPDNPGSPDLGTATAFVADATLLNGRRYLRWQVTFDIATDPMFPASGTTPRPQVNLIRIPFWY